MNPISDADLHAFLDRELEPARAAEVAAYLETHPDAAQQVNAICLQNEALHVLFDPMLAEPVPGHLLQRRHAAFPAMRYAAIVAWLAVGAVAGWALRGYVSGSGPQAIPLAHQAAVAHAVYVPEVRHPVEVGADQEQHLVAWLSKRLGAQVKAPNLNELGYGLVGGRLLPAPEGPAAQFMYQDTKGGRLTLYVRPNVQQNQDAVFRYARDGRLSVFYWVEGALGYALSGDLEKDKLLQIANAVYRAIQP
jgi:anti-sigma factor RsiW